MSKKAPVKKKKYLLCWTNRNGGDPWEEHTSLESIEDKIEGLVTDNEIYREEVEDDVKVFEIVKELKVTYNGISVK